MAGCACFENVVDVLKRHRATFENKLDGARRGAAEAVEEARGQCPRGARQGDARPAGRARRAEAALEVQRATLASARRRSRGGHEHWPSARRTIEKAGRASQGGRRVRDPEDGTQTASSALLLEEFIKDRSSTDEYRKQLGLLALVRRDFERSLT